MPQICVTWSGSISTASGFAVRSVSRPQAMSRRTAKALTTSGSSGTFGVPRLGRSGPQPLRPEIGSRGSEARIASASIASTTARDHW
ncbi:hypothetical protein ACSCBZ_08195 [Streptomyces niveiscabiei]|uniref:hypothetical protein n=1 Tax=Streptomyces niveiscabiei TaxID=164115 RepID=UPI0006EB9BD3|nr:hypothetical protein [Streptomyces niveiscabiei]